MIGKNIYELRKKRGLTLSELADRAKVSKSYLSNIERNLNKNPSITVIKKIAAVLDVDLKIILKTGTLEETQHAPDKEWLDFVKELQDSGVDKSQIHDYKILLEFIKWQNQTESKKT